MSILDVAGTSPSPETGPSDIFSAGDSALDAARAKIQTSTDADPQRAVKSMAIGNALGVPPQVVDNDHENFEKIYGIGVSAALAEGNPQIVSYLNSHPMAAKVSKNDLENLDGVSKAVGGFSATTALQAAIRGFKENFDYGASEQEFERYQQWLVAHPVFNNFIIRQAAESGGAALFTGFQLASGVIGGAAAGVGELFKQASGSEAWGNRLTRDLITLAQVSMGGEMARPEGLLRPEMRSAIDEAAKLGKTISPYLEDGKEPPVGIHPAIDEAKAEVAKTDRDSLSDALKASLKSETREIAPDLFQSFLRQHTDADIGVSADAIRKLYGDKVPEPEDGILGWVPGIQDQLATAESTGGDVRIPVADWLAKVEPEVAKELQDHVRFREGGLTVEEAKEHETPEGEGATPVDDLRRANALEPLSSGFKLVEGEPVGEAHIYSIQDHEGKDLGHLNITEENEGKRLYVDDTGVEGGAGAIGTRGVRDLTNQLFAQYPKAEEIAGEHVSGAKEKTGKASAKLSIKRPKQLKLPQEGTTRLEDREAFTPAPPGFTADMYKKYIKLIDKRQAEDVDAAEARALAYQRKTQTAEWKANRAELRPSVKDEILARSDHELDEMLRDGRVKLASDSLTPEQRAALPKEYVGKEGIHPDDLAGMFGHDSGDSLVNQLINLVKTRETSGMKPAAFLQRVIDAETDRQMEAKYGKLDQSIIEEAKDQVLSETQLDILHEETIARASEAGLTYSIPKAKLVESVKAHFNDLPLRQISSDKFLADAGREGRRSELEHLKGNAAEAFKHAQRREFAFIYAKEAGKLEKDRERFDKLAKRYSAREVPSTDQEYTNFIHDILLKTGNSIKRSVQDLQETIARGEHKSLAEFVDFKELHDMREVPVAEFLLDPGFRKSMDDLTAEEFRAVNDSVKALAKNGRDEKKIIKAGEEADLNEVKRQMIEELSTFAEKHYDAAGGRWLGPLPPGVARPLRTYMVSHLQLESIFNRWDRGDPKGVFTQYVARELASSANGEAALERKYSRMLREVVDKADLKEKIPNDLFRDPLSGSPIVLTRKNLRAILLNAGNPSNLEKLARGYKIGTEGVDGKFHAAPELVHAWLDAHATKEDWDWAQKIGDIFAEIKKEADVMYRGLSGIEPENIHIEPITTPHGEYPGWYYPVVYHPVWEGASRKLMGGEALEQDNYHRATTPRGYTKARTGYAAPLALDLDMMPVRMRQMLHDIAFRPSVIQASKIFYDKDVRAAVTKHYGSEYTKMLVPYLKDVANSANYRNDAQQMFTRVSEFMRQNIIATLVGLNPGTVLKHGPTAAMNSITEVGAMPFLKAAKGLFSINDATGETNWQFAMKNSEELQRRHRFYRETLGGAHEELQGTPSLRDQIISIGSTPVAMSDLLSAVPTWMAKYSSEMADHGVHGDAVYEADRAVRRAHGSSVITNRPQVMRTGPMGSWLASLYGFFSHIMNRQYEMAWRAGDVLKLTKEGEYAEAMSQVPKISGMFFSYVIFPAIVEELVTGFPDDKHEGFLKKSAKALAYSVSASWIGVRDLVSAMIAGRDPSIGLLSTTYKTASDVARDLNKNRPFSKQHAGSLIQHGATALGAATGLVNQQVGRSGRFAYNVETGQERPKGPWGWLVGLRYGTLAHHSQTFQQYMRGR